MSRHFSANQFESGFKPQHLNNWEVSNRYSLWPRARKGPTRIIADDRGHLLPGVPRAGSPWGNYRSTWKLPRKITRKLASEINGSSCVGARPLTSWEKRSAHVPLVTANRFGGSARPLTPISRKEKKKHLSKKREGRKINEFPPFHKDEHDYSYTLGCDRATKVLNTSQRVREDIEGYTKTCRSPSTKKVPSETLDLKAEGDLSQNGDSPVSDDAKHSNGDPVEDVVAAARGSNASDEQSVKSGRSSKPSRSSTPKSEENLFLKTPPPLDTVFLSSQYAKNLALDNQKHQPLPDTVGNAQYKALQMKRAKIPGSAIDNTPKSVAVGCKTFASPGPTQCSKLKVYRPKTAPKPKKKSKDTSARPKTGFAHTKEISEIDLALCWDLIPRHPDDEPRRTVHIDGSNGSAAPSVFTMVKPTADDLKLEETETISKDQKNGKKQKSQPKPAWVEKKEKSQTRLTETANPSAVMDIISNNDLMAAPRNENMARSSPSGNPGPSGAKENKNPNIPNQKSRESSANSSGKKSSKLSQDDSVKSNYTDPPSMEGSAGNNKRNPYVHHDNHKSNNHHGNPGNKGNNSFESSFDSEKLSKQKHYRSSPNLPDVGVGNSKSKRKMIFSRPCMACETKDSSIPFLPRPKSEYKMAFKAGKPNSNNSNPESQNSSNRPHTAKPLNVPKPKTPFAKRSYSIATLIPPFSLWPGTTGMDYPEHWRLASVYQHSFKPLDARKKTLLQSVYQ